MLGLRDSPWRISDSQPEQNKRKIKGTSNSSIHQSIGDLSAPTVQPFRLYWSVCLCVVIIFINVGNAIICQVGEWKLWMSPSERDQLRTNLSVLAVQGTYLYKYYRISLLPCCDDQRKDSKRAVFCWLS